ncbi:MAG: sensor histidine kinase [Crocinitomicaceae bacterium]|nr:sensor histidine kinase [Crocinitomicaceae bacterium]
MDGVLQENTLVPMIAAGILIMLAFALAFVIFASYSQKKILREKMQNQEELLHSTILTQEEERKRIARDLHDAIGSKLNVILLNIYRLKDVSLNETDVTEITDEVESVIHTTIDSTRLISHDLLPPTLEEFGLVEAIREFQYNVNRLGGIQIEVIVDGETAIADKLVELNLFRVIQELSNNSMKHGQASKVSINLQIDEANLKLSYSDDGVGFNPDKQDGKKGLGMKNIESRLQMINADFTHQSALGEGVQMNIELTNTLV